VDDFVLLQKEMYYDMIYGGNVNMELVLATWRKS
jgi:hypothetical protein